MSDFYKRSFTMFKKIVCAALIVLPASALAAPYFTAGGAFGSTDMGDIEQTYTGPGVTTDDKVARAIIGGGVDINQYLAGEALYMTKVKDKVTQGTLRDELSHQGFQFAVLGKAPLAAQFSLLGKLSANVMKVDYDFRDTAFPTNSMTNNKTSVYLGFGVGAEFQVNDAVAIRFMAERIMMNGVTIVGTTGTTDADFNVDQASLAVKFNF
jgi:opacity protein-like surface antigen